MKIQERLARLGFNPGKPDGIFGGQTAAAVRDFQNKHGMTPDGEVGKDTLKALKIKMKG
jgi:peptidoglycan hydrolase-like protein with peptidoglycan-binding domain